MFFGNRRTRQRIAGRRPAIGNRPRLEDLEDRTLLSIDLGVTTPPSNPLIATIPYGMDFAGGTTLPTTSGTPTTISQGGAGWSVSDVGNVTGTGYDSFVIGAPTVSSATTIGPGAGSAAYLVFGSQSVGVSAVTDWIGKLPSGAYQYTADDRVSDLSMLGAATQTNPISTVTPQTFPFAGLAFTTTASSQLGESVSSVKLGNTYGILLGAPGASDSTGANPGTGRAYLITGNFSNFVGQTINLDTPTVYSGLTIYTFVNTAVSGSLGYSVSGGSNIFGDGNSDVILGAPNASYGAINGTGVVYALSTALLSGSTSTINVSTIGQSGSQSAIFTGASQGSQAGWSVADGGDVNGVTSGGTNVDDLMIGSPSQNGSGAAFVIYGGSNLANLAQTVNVNGTNLRYISLALVGAATGTTGAVPGAAIVGPTGSQTGFSVSSGGDFNGDGYGDVLIGSPHYGSSSTLTNQGLASLFYGAPSTSGAYLTGVFNLASPSAGITPLYLQGALSGSLAGYSVSPVGLINTGQPTLILVGSPGYNNNAGTAYLIPGRSGGLTGSQTLADAESAPISGVQFLLSTPGAPSASTPFFGASVSSRIQTTSFTADSDSRQDFIIGAPGYDATQDSTRNLAGGAMVVQGGLITVPIAASNQLTVPITVGAPLTSATINATTPANLQIYVYGITTSGGETFQPVSDIDPTTIVVNSVAFPNASLTPDTNKANWVNGIQDAIITITPRSSLGLKAGSQTITLTGNTLSTSVFAGEVFTGSATVTVTGSSGGGGGGGGGSGLVAGASGGPVQETTYISHFGPDQSVPTLQALSAYNYAPIPLTVALQQYKPSLPFADRLYNFNHPTKHLPNSLAIRTIANGQQQATGIFMGGKHGRFSQHIFLDNRINDRSKYHESKSYTLTDRANKSKSTGVYTGVVPTQLTTQHVADVPGVAAKGTTQVGHPPTDSGSYNANNAKRGGGGG